MLSKQNKLISKLKTECKRQAGQIESIMKKNRSVVCYVMLHTGLAQA